MEQQIIQDILVGAAGDGTGGLIAGMLTAVGSRVARRFQPDELAKGLREALEVSLLAAFETLPQDVSSLTRDHYLQALADFLREKVVQEELSVLLNPDDAFDIECLRAEFTRITQGYTPEQIPDLDFDAFVGRLLAAFYAAVKQIESLQAVIQIERLDSLVRLAGANLRANQTIATNTAELVMLVRQLLRELRGETAVTVDQTQLFDEEEALQTYCDWVAASYDEMRILGMTEPVPLRDIYTDVHILQRPAALRRFSPEALEEEFRELGRMQRRHEQDRHDGLQLVAGVDRLFILGGPGAGKTTFLKYVAVQTADSSKPTDDKLPVFIRLREWADADMGLQAFITQQFQVCLLSDAEAQVQGWLQTGRLRLLLDGLDEVPQANDKRRRLLREIDTLARLYRHCPVIVTCRIAAHELALETFTYVEMADFDPRQVQTFISHWFDKQKQRGQAMGAELQKEEHAGIRELARSPLLLAMLCLVYDATLNFPARRVEIYEEALDTLLKQWDVTRDIRRDSTYGELSLGRKKQMLQRIAFDNFRADRLFIPQDILEAQLKAYLKHVPEMPDEIDLEADRVLRDIAAQHGLFVERARGVYSFSHLTFQEYFAARYIVENSIQGTLIALMQHVFDDGWREVFLLTASMLDNGKSFFDAYQKTLDDLIDKDRGLSDFLHWADEKQACAKSPASSPVTLRAAYIFLERDLTFVHALDLLFDFPLDQALRRSLKRDRDIALDLVLDLTQDLTLDRDCNDDLWLDVGLWCYWVLTIYYLDLDTEELFGAMANLQNILVMLSRKLSQEKLTKELRKIIIPPLKSTHDECKEFTRTIKRLLQTQRRIKLNWDLSNAQWRQLEAYLNGARLLVACLDVAYVADRAAIEDRILRPPTS